MSPSGSPSASVLTPSSPKYSPKYYVVLDKKGNCAVIHSKLGDDLKIVGDKGGYASRESAYKALEDAADKCKETVGTGADAKFIAAQAKAAKVGVENLTKEDIDGLSDTQVKQLRGY
jgi:hypothetical protein